MRFHCANGLEVLCVCAPQREHCRQLTNTWSFDDQWRIQTRRSNNGTPKRSSLVKYLRLSV